MSEWLSPRHEPTPWMWQQTALPEPLQAPALGYVEIDAEPFYPHQV
jgi:hypothetical protein